MKIVQLADYDAFGYEHYRNTIFAGNTPQQYRYQNQLRIDDFDIGWDMFKFRASDNQLGRFFRIDPVAADYVYNSPYALQENKFGLGVELEGKELSEFLVGARNAMYEDIIPLQPSANRSFESNSYGAGKFTGHLASMVFGALEIATGGTGDAGSAVATFGSAGLASPISIPVAIASTALIVHGASVIGKATKNMSASKQEGSYTNTHESGKKYHGKGDEKRARKSGEEKANQNSDPVKDTDWTPSKSSRDAYKDESKRMQTDKGGHNSSSNYNKRDSPGTKYRKQDGDK